MELFSLTKQSFLDTLSSVERVLNSGGVVAIPTDTVYGLCANAFDALAVKKIYSIKKRAKEKALPVFVGDILEARKYAYISDAKADFLSRVWPGPVTVVFSHKEKFPSVLTAGKDTAAFRIPNSPVILELLSRCGYPLAQTSANISDAPTGVSGREVYDMFKNENTKPDCIVDAGIIQGVSSTIIDFSGACPSIIRAGARNREELDVLFKLLS